MPQPELDLRFLKCGLTAAEATQALVLLAEAARKVPFPEGKTLRSLLLRRWIEDYGWIRVFYWEWWKFKLERVS